MEINPDNPFSQKTRERLFDHYPSSNGVPLARRQEGTYLEFKKSFNLAGLADYSKEMVAFANTNGGYIIFGIKDKPHVLKGLSREKVDQFEKFEPSKLTAFLDNHFSHDINFDELLYEHLGKKFGLFYIKKSSSRPHICTSSFENDGEFLFREGEILYRYDSESKSIKFPELREIIREKVNKEKRRWQQIIEQMKAVEDPSKATVLDYEEGTLDGKKVVMDEDLIKDIEFLKEGEFHEKKGAKALKLVGEVEGIGPKTGIPKDLETDDIFRSFLNGNCTHPKIYLKHLRYEYQYMPVWFFVDEISNPKKAIRILDKAEGGKRGIKSEIINRIKEAFTYQEKIREGAISYQQRFCKFYNTISANDMEEYYSKIPNFFKNNSDIMQSMYQQVAERNLMFWLLINESELIRDYENWSEIKLKILAQSLTHLKPRDVNQNSKKILWALNFLRKKYRKASGSVQGIIRKSFANIDLQKYGVLYREEG